MMQLQPTSIAATALLQRVSSSGSIRRALHGSHSPQGAPLKWAPSVSGGASDRRTGRVGRSPCSLLARSYLTPSPFGLRPLTRPVIAAAPWISTRHFATSSGSSSDGRSRSGPLPAHFVPFGRSLGEAQSAYLGWARGQLMAPPSLQSLRAVQTTDQAYLPFYVFDAVSESRFGGRVGHRYSELVWNASSRTWQNVQRTRWSSVAMQPASRAVYTSDDPSMQVYGAFKYKWEPIQVVKAPLSPPGTVRTPAQMSPSDFAGREVDVFEMRLETAAGRVMDYIRAKEEERGTQFLLELTGADEVEIVAEVHVLSCTLRRVYQPAYVFHVEHLGQRFEVMVNGRTGAVWGQHIYSGTKAGMASLVAATSVWAYAAGVMHAVPFSFFSFVVGAVLPALVGGFIGHHWANVREHFREKKRVADRAADAAAEHSQQQPRWGRWDWGQQQQQQSAGWNEQQRTEQRYEEQYQRQQQQQQRQGFGQRFRRAAPSQTLYDVLGIKKNASLDDIRTAFRAKSFQYHPDVNKGNEKDANAKFRQILDAYHTLRDPKKRADYDRSIGG